jgi:D-tyrosyl-tRNA(Tyr) deacylase
VIALVQRARSARVEVGGRVVGAIGRGVLVLLGVRVGDTPDEALWLARKTARLRLFPDPDAPDERPSHTSLLDVGGEALVVSQFTLYADTSKGNRPSYVDAARPETAEPLYDAFCEALARELSRPVARGIFGAHMDISLAADGPVTLTLERLPG